LDEFREIVYIFRILTELIPKGAAMSHESPPITTKESFVRSIADASTILDMFGCLDDVYFFMKDRQSRFMGANALQLEKLGLATESDIIGKTDYDFFPSYMIAHYHADDQMVMKTGRPVMRRSELVANPDGSMSWHITSKFPIFDAGGNCIGIVGIMRDLERSASARRPYREMRKVVDHISTHYAEPLRMGRLAKVAGLSISQFERRFQKALGQTPSRFVIQYRLTKASQLLAQSTYTIGRIALEVGFYDHSHFTREFRKMFGLPPGRYRQEHAG